jgi:hypothetical protein
MTTISIYGIKLCRAGADPGFVGFEEYSSLESFY